MPTDSALLAEVPMFQLMDEHERSHLAADLDEVAFASGETIFEAGDPGDAMYIVRSGEVEIFFKDSTGNRIILETPRAGDFFGELSLLDGGSRTAGAVALTDVETLCVDRQDLDNLFSAHPNAAMDLLAAMGRRLRYTAELLRHTASRNVNEETDDQRSRVDKAADWIAAYSGSIPFLCIHIVLFAAWITWNVLPWSLVFDPFPFGFLTLAVSLEAIMLSVFVLLSQNRQIEKARVHADVEYDVNLKAELEVMQLHEKVDRLTAEVLRRLSQIEQHVSGNRKP